MPSKPPSVEEYLAKEMKRQIHRSVTELRDLADRIERMSDDVDRIGSAGTTNAGVLVAHILSTFTNGLNNVPLDQIARAAGDLDSHRGRQ